MDSDRSCDVAKPPPRCQTSRRTIGSSDENGRGVIDPPRASVSDGTNAAHNTNASRQQQSAAARAAERIRGGDRDPGCELPRVIAAERLAVRRDAVVLDIAGEERADSRCRQLGRSFRALNGVDRIGIQPVPRSGMMSAARVVAPQAQRREVFDGIGDDRRAS